MDGNKSLQVRAIATLARQLAEWGQLLQVAIRIRAGASRLTKATRSCVRERPTA
jgi:hypothetical protein